MSIPAAAYIRVSSEMQVEVGSSLPSQLAAIREYAQRNGYEILPEHIYSDEGASARTADRPEFQRMVGVAKRDPAPFQAILCYDNSRFARSREDAIVFKALLRKRGIALHFVKQDFDDSPMGRFMEGLIEVVDQWYSENLAIETKRGLKQNARDGYATGGRPPYGLRRVEVTNEYGAAKARWEPDPITSEIVRRIYRAYVDGKGYRAIAYELNGESLPSPSGGLWNANTLYYILHKNQPAYLGKQIYGRERSRDSLLPGKYNPEDSWVVNDAAWEPIISEETARKATARGRKNNRHATYKKEGPVLMEESFILTGKVFCEGCGAAMTGSGGNSASGKYRYYRCGAKSRSGTKACTSRSVPKKVLEDAVFRAIRTYLPDSDFLRQVYDDYMGRCLDPSAGDEKRLKEIERALKRKDEERRRLVGSLMKGTFTDADVRPFLAQIDHDVMVLEDEKALLSTVSLDSLGIGPKDFEDFAYGVRTLTSLDSPRMRMQMIDSWVEKVTVNKKSISVVFAINPTDVGISINLENGLFAFNGGEGGI